jgi:hypothetical protein
VRAPDRAGAAARVADSEFLYRLLEKIYNNMILNVLI